jgi:K+-transporting ATPase KdpF subunit
MGLQPPAATRGTAMNGWLVLAAVLAAGLLIYLVAVLLRPEDFS